MLHWHLLAVRLLTVATNEVEEISLPLVASLLPAVPTVAAEISAGSLPTIATDQIVASVSLLSTAFTAAIPTPVVIANLQYATTATTSGSAGTYSNGRPWSLAASDSLVNSCITETRTDNHIDDDNDKESINSYHRWSRSSSETDSSEWDCSHKTSKKRSRPTSDDHHGNSSEEKSRKKPTSQRSNNNRDSFSKNGNNVERQFPQSSKSRNGVSEQQSLSE